MFPFMYFQMGKICRHTFGVAAKHYFLAKFLIDLDVFKKNHFKCPCCGDKIKVVHIHGNRKVYNWKCASRYYATNISIFADQSV